MDKTQNNKAWFLVLPVLLVVAILAILILLTVVSYLIYVTFGTTDFLLGGLICLK